MALLQGTSSVERMSAKLLNFISEIWVDGQGEATVPRSCQVGVGPDPGTAQPSELVPPIFVIQESPGALLGRTRTT